MRLIQDCFDYREYIRDFYNTHKGENPIYSVRYWAQRASMDPSHFVKIMQGARHISERSIPTFSALMGLQGHEAEYFATLVRFNKAKSDREAKRFFEALLSFKDVSAYRLEKEQYEFFQKWYYSAVLVLLKYYRFSGDFSALAAQLSPPIKPVQAEAAIALLSNLKLIDKMQDGVYTLTNNFITTGEPARSMSVKTFQEEVIRLAAESLHRHNKEDRNISTVTITLARKDLPVINETIRQFRQKLLKFADGTDSPDSVFQLNVQLFPLTGPGRKI